MLSPAARLRSWSRDRHLLTVNLRRRTESLVEEICEFDIKISTLGFRQDQQWRMIPRDSRITPDHPPIVEGARNRNSDVGSRTPVYQVPPYLALPDGIRLEVYWGLLRFFKPRR
jgi:hypothetical protein